MTRQSVRLELGTDGRMWNVDQHGTRWRISDALDGLPGCEIEDDMRSPALRDWEDRRDLHLRDLGVGFAVNTEDGNDDYFEAVQDFEANNPKPIR